ncbi:MAG: sigma-54 dependent transcriptional regulator [Polyangiaceae bacterium]|jgi:DNA-binding NtrC family response regulator
MTDEIAHRGPSEIERNDARVLLFEDDDSLAELLARVLRHEGYRVDILDSGRAIPPPEAIVRYDAVLTDVHLAGDTSGHDVLRRIREISPATPVILMTAYADVDGAMSAVGEGAYEYLSKPIDPTDLKRMVSEAIARRRLSESPDLGGDVRPPTGLIVGTDPAMLAVYKTVAHVAPTTATVLVVGESGTGKELVARAIHARSARKDKPFVAINCGSLPESLLESELFGHERGAFTGAIGTKRGLFEEAHGGTLLLDEIGEIGPKMQVELLRVLQEREVRRVGGEQSVRVDVRVLATTNRDLRAEVKAGRFREDLLFRLQVVTVVVPPLRERRGDIPPLVWHFVGQHSKALGRPAPRLAPNVVETLERYDFPGNVRELSHIVERAVLLAREGVVTVADLPPELQSAPGNTGGPVDSVTDDWPTLAVLERRYIDRMLSRTGGNKSRAAELLGIDRRTLARILARDRRSGES